MSKTYRVTFDRISRDHNVPPLDVVAVDNDPAGLADRLADAVYHYARPRTLSRGIEVVVDADKMTGTIFAGMQVAGSFTVEAVA